MPWRVQYLPPCFPTYIFIKLSENYLAHFTLGCHWTRTKNSIKVVITSLCEISFVAKRCSGHHYWITSLFRITKCVERS